MAVSFLDVQLAIEQLIEQKKPLTLINLRSALGERGSMTTLSKYLQKWKTEKHIDASIHSVSSLVQPAPDQIFSAVQNVWQEMVSLKDKELNDYQLFHEAENQKWLEEKNHYLHQIDHFKEMLRNLTALYDEQKNEVLFLKQTLDLEKQAFFALEQKYEHLRLQSEQNLSLKTQEMHLLDQNYQQQLGQLRSLYDKVYQDLCTLQNDYTDALQRQATHHASLYEKLQNDYYQLQIELSLVQQKTDLMLQWDKQISKFETNQKLLSQQLLTTIQEILHDRTQPHPWVHTPCVLSLR